MRRERAMDGMKIGVLGAGVSGVSLALFASRMGADVLLSDAGEIAVDVLHKMERNGIVCESGGHTAKVFSSDRIVLSSGFPPAAKILDEARKRGLPVEGELDFVIPHVKGRFISVTGSNGKTTTTSLIGHLLKALGHDVAVVGNIGNPIGDIGGEGFDYIVAEFSSFQLHWASAIHVDMAIVTNLAPDHLDWHGSYDNYVGAKARLFDFVGENGHSLMKECDRELLEPRPDTAFTLLWGREGGERNVVLDEIEKKASLGDERLFSFQDTKLLGRHNMENVAFAAAALFLSGEDLKAARSSLASYDPPPHRCALVLTEGGVRYIDDSKGTNVTASVTALTSIEGRKIVILGGRGKGEDYANLLPAVREQAKQVLLIGEAAGEIGEALHEGGYGNVTFAANMEEAVKLAVKMAEVGDVVLLSPACTSWDAYKNYGERGDHFASLVLKYARGQNR